MKRLTTLTAICSVLVLTLSLTAFSQNPPQPAPGGGGANPPAAQAPQSAEKTYSGQLAKVNATSKEIVIKGADNKEMIFTYDDKTQITGVEGPQGLAGKTGSDLKVTYRDNRGANLATKIDVSSK
ncbi:MAG TPA: hypothetical protein VFE29_06935 [Terriglobia bacterium]|nr:hypothetical protein [Terriglobia bacterium]